VESSRPAALEQLFYFHSALADHLLHDVVTEAIVPMRERGGIVKRLNASFLKLINRICSNTMLLATSRD